MKKSDFRNLLQEVSTSLIGLTESKGQEYANSSESQTANFERQAVALGLPPEAVLMVYLSKHIDSIQCYIRHLQGKAGYVSSEPIEGRISDAILYLCLLRALVEDRKGTVSHTS